MNRLFAAELIIVTGWLLVLWALWRIYQPTALLLCGITLITLGIGHAKRAGGLDGK